MEVSPWMRRSMRLGASAIKVFSMPPVRRRHGRGGRTVFGTPSTGQHFGGYRPDQAGAQHCGPVRHRGSARAREIGFQSLAEPWLDTTVGDG